MAQDSLEPVPAGGPPLAARPRGLSRRGTPRRLLIDRVSRRVVTLGGAAIIASILAILVVILIEIAPLFRPPSATHLATITGRLTAGPLAVGVDEHRQIAYLVTAAGVQFVSLADSTAVPSPPIPGLNGARITGASGLGRGPFALGLSDGRVIPAEVRFTVTYPGDRRRVQPDLVTETPVLVDPAGGAIERLAYAVTRSGPLVVAATGPHELTLLLVRETRPLVGSPTRETVRRRVAVPADGRITALVMDSRGDAVFVGTSAGQVVVLNFGDSGALATAVQAMPVTSRSGVAVTLLGLLLGDRTLMVGDADGAVSTWQLLQDAQGRHRLVRIHEFARHNGPVVAFASSRRDKGFLTADAAGQVLLHYGTTGRTLLAVQDQPHILALTYAPKADAFLSAGAPGALAHWAVRNPHPEVTLRSLFGKVWYEGYTQPEYVWQSTGSTDDFESKLSLTPLVFGTLKGTFYALLIAVPLAVLGALYASQFMHPSLRGYVKPVVEIMAALPSVVLGFLAGLWLAPRVEKVVPGIFLMPLVIPLLVLLGLAVWRLAPAALRRRVPPGAEVSFLIPVVLLGGWIAFRLGALVELALLGGDYRGWLFGALGLTYDQRNSLVVGVAMGFAVMPVIFAITEDSLSNVPAHLTAASLALGATRWQTAIRVILPTASPGIFSAIMIGFGRAVGETMIVLMATGNTPVMDWSIFNGFRALSANVAVELPEAPHGGTLYRVLFMAAFMLFAMTFVVNTAAEIVRLRLRKRYQSL